MNEHQPLAELAIQQRLTDVAAGPRTPRLAPPRRPRGHRRHVLASGLRRVADRLDG